MKIWLVWATNVWKSTLFNRLIWQFRAIVTDIHWTTRDILHHQTKFEDVGDVIFLDSPGLQEFQEERKFIRKIVDEADLILFVIDDKAWITAKEQAIFGYIIEKWKKNNTILVINKIDMKYKENETDLAISDYYSLGFDKIIWISAKKWRNVDQLKQLIATSYMLYAKSHKKEKHKAWSIQHPANFISLAILGKPNAGKSTLLNTLVGKPLSKVENIPWTTRDYVTWSFFRWTQKYNVYDTAGIKKKWSMHGIEKIAYDKTLDMIKYIRPTIIFIIDATLWITHRDMTILQEINNQALPIICLLNKIDLLKETQVRLINTKIQAFLDFAKYIPIVPISAKTWQGIPALFKMLWNIKNESSRRIDTNKLNKIISSEFISRPPRFPQNKICKIFYITQTDINAPTFVAFVNHKSRANFAFKRWIENTIRKHFGFVWTPIVIRFKERRE